MRGLGTSGISKQATAAAGHHPAQHGTGFLSRDTQSFAHWIVGHHQPPSKSAPSQPRSHLENRGKWHGLQLESEKADEAIGQRTTCRSFYRWGITVPLTIVCDCDVSLVRLRPFGVGVEGLRRELLRCPGWVTSEENADRLLASGGRGELNDVFMEVACMVITEVNPGVAVSFWRGEAHLWR